MKIVTRRNHRAKVRGLLSASIAVLAALMTGCGQSDIQLPRNTQTIGGMTIDIGVIPAEVVQGHSTIPGDPKAMHGGTPANSGSHHLVVALFDDKTGVRITDARIRAGVADLSDDPTPDRILEPMEVSGAMTYGNFFLMQGKRDWKIRLEIRRSSTAPPVEADFAYGHDSDG